MTPNHFIRAWRKYRCYSVRRLAEDAGLAASTIGGLETGNALYSQRSLEAIAKALEVTPAQLLGGPPGKLVGQVSPSLESQMTVAVRQFEGEVMKALDRAARDMKKRMMRR